MVNSERKRGEVMERDMQMGGVTARPPAHRSEAWQRLEVRWPGWL